jgi:hypothetical protein
MKDEFDGHGGTYLLDPATGRRTLLRRTSTGLPDSAAPEPQASEAGAEPTVEPPHETEKDTP